MKRREEKKVRRTKRHVDANKSRGTAVDFGNQHVANLVHDLIRDYSSKEELNILDNRHIISMVYKYILQNKDKLISDEYGAVKSLNVKTAFARFMSYSGIFAYVVTLIIFAMNYGLIDLPSIFMMTGLSVMGTGFLTSASLLRKSNNSEVIENLIKDMEDTYGIECLSDKRQQEISEVTDLAVTTNVIQQDAFLSEIKIVVEYAKRNPGIDFTNEISKLAGLTQEYIGQKREFIKTGKEMTRFDLVSKLTDIELKIFSPRTGIGLKRNYLLGVKGYQLTERLKFMGLSESDIMQDRALKGVFQEITRIFTNSYEGCERELIQLFRIAQNYCKRAFPLVDPSTGSVPVVNDPTAQLFKELGNMQDTISTNINMAIEADKKPLLQDGSASCYEEAAKTL